MAPGTDLMSLAIALLIAGAITGLLAGIFGVGGGAVVVPVLYQVFGALEVPEQFRMPLAVGTSLAVIFPTSIGAFRVHLAKGSVDMTVVRLWAVPYFFGVVVGSAIAAIAPSWVFKLVFVAIAGSNGVNLLIGRKDWRLLPDLPRPFPMRLLGFAIGVLAALMGISGGMLSNVVLLMFNRTIHQAVATSSALGIIIAVPGTVGYILAGWPHMADLPPYSAGYVSIVGLAFLAPTTLLLAPWGARAAHAFSRRRLEIAFGIYLLAVSIRFVANLV